MGSLNCEKDLADLEKLRAPVERSMKELKAYVDEMAEAMKKAKPFSPGNDLGGLPKNMHAEVKNLSASLDNLEAGSKAFHKKVYDVAFDKVKKEKDKNQKELGSKSCVAVHDYLEGVDDLIKSGRQTVPNMEAIAAGGTVVQQVLRMTTTDDALRAHHQEKEREEALKMLKEFLSEIM